MTKIQVTNDIETLQTHPHQKPDLPLDTSVP